MGTSAAEHLGALEHRGELVRLLCRLEPRDAADRPTWLHILPHGPEVEARDGRRFAVRELASVTAATELPMLVDWEHASEAGDTRAAGWIEELRIEPSSAGARAGLWGRVAWTPKGREDVRARLYRYLSPVVLGRRAHSSGRQLFHVERIASVALTNRPALRLAGIEALSEQLSLRVGAARPRPPSVLRGIDLAALRAHGIGEELALEVATELYGKKPQPNIDRAALRRLGLTDAEITEAERF